MSRFSRFVMVLLLSLGLVATGGIARDLLQVEAARKSVVSVLPKWPGKAPNAERPEGSGVVVDDGKTVVTAAHVIGSGRRVAPEVLVRDHDGNRQWAKVLIYDPRTDLAVMQIQMPLPVAKWAKAAPVRGEEVCAIGNAFGLGLSVTCGHVSAVHRAGVGFNPIEDFIQTDAAINPGASGGALVNRKGELNGIVAAIFTKQADANIGVNFAVDARLVRQFLDAHAKTGKFVPFNPGFAVKKVPTGLTSGREGVEVAKMFPNFFSDEPIIKAGDIIYYAAGRRIRSRADWISVLAASATAENLELTGTRQGKPHDWQLGRQPAKK